MIQKLRRMLSQHPIDGTVRPAPLNLSASNARPLSAVQRELETLRRSQ